MIVIVILAIRSTLRFVGVALRLYRSARRSVPEGISDEILATCALGAPFERLSEAFAALTRFSLGGAIQNPGALVSGAEIQFLQNWNECHMAIRKTRQAGFLAFGLSFASLIFGVMPTHQMFANGSLDTVSILYLTANQLLAALGVNLTLSFVIYYIASYFDDVLCERKKNWTDLASHWRRTGCL